jgi:hypothetical protein
MKHYLKDALRPWLRHEVLKDFDTNVVSLDRLEQKVRSLIAEQRLTAGDIQQAASKFPTSTNPHFDWAEHYEKVAKFLNERTKP